jgi:very-short-patch-repair endonuclease
VSRATRAPAPPTLPEVDGVFAEVRSKLLPAAAARIASRQHGRVAREQLLAAGARSAAISRALGKGWLSRVHQGVYAVAGTPDTREAAWMGAVLAGGRGALLGERSACELWGIAAPIEGPVHVMVATGGRRRPGIRFHRCPDLAQHRDECRSIPVTSVERSLLDYAGWASPRDLYRAVEAADRRNLLDARKLLLLSSGTRKGSGRLAALALDCAPQVDTWSPLERDFLRFCQRRRLPVPLVNQNVEGFSVDCFWPAQGLVVELDSYGFHRPRERFEFDRRRDIALQLAGLRAFRVTARRLKADPEGLERDLRAALGLGQRRARPANG